MRRLIVCVGLVLTVIAVASPTYSQTPVTIWSQHFGSSLSDYGYSVATDAAGNVFVTGSFQGTADFGGGNLASAGNDDIFLAKYSPTGAHLWSKRFGSYNSDRGYSVATDASGNVFVTGIFDGTVDFGGGNLPTAGYGDIFVAKFDPSGTHLWSHGFGSASDNDSGYSVATDAAGNVFVTGYFAGTVDFGGGPLVSAGNYDIFLAKFSSTGTHLWSHRFGSTAADNGYSVATDAQGSVFLTGDFQGTVDFGGGNLVCAGNTDVVLAKYSASGTHVWSHRYGDIGLDHGYAVATDGSGNVFVTGNFYGTVDFGGGDLVSAGAVDIFLAKYDTNGTELWSQRLGGDSLDIGYCLATDILGDVVVAGSFYATANFGGGDLTSAGASDIFVAKYTAAGAHLWSQHAGSISTDDARGVAVDPSGDVFVTGEFFGTVDFGTGGLTAAGQWDAFLVKYVGATVRPRITTITDIGNDQGRKVNIRFERSAYDYAQSATPIWEYQAYRRDDPTPSTTLAGDPATLSTRQLLDSGWTQVGAVAAHATWSYGIDVPTVGDSTIALGQYYSHFFIRAATGTPATYFDSPPDSGYSVDNLAPGIPQNFVFNAGNLTWDKSTAGDFDYFTVYGANTDDFGVAVVVDYSVSPAMDVTASPYAYYYVTATDFSGNEGKPNSVNALSGVNGTPKSYVLSLSNYPNPFNPRTTVSYTLPSKGHVTISVYDASGARVATLFDGERNAGAYSVGWDGRAASGTPVSSGIYFARIEHSSGVRTRKMVLLK